MLTYDVLQPGDRASPLPLSPADPAGAATEQLELALAAAQLGDWSWDAVTEQVRLSARAAGICGVPTGAPLSLAAALAFVHPADRELLQRVLGASLREQRDYSLECRVLTEASERWIKLSGHPRFGPTGELLGILGVVQDLSNDRFLLQLEDALRPLVEPEELSSAAARLLGQRLDVERCAYAFVEDDQDTFTLTGNYTRDVDSIVGRYRFRQFGAECLRLLRAGEAWVVEDSATDPRLDAADREAYRLTAITGVVCVPIVKSGRFVAAMAVHTTRPRRFGASEVELVKQVASRCWESIERARVEDERRQLLEAAQSANRAKDEFLAMLGHELRNPLAPIQTALQLMKLRAEAGSERERTVIERQVSHLTRLVDDLLDVAAIARGKVVLKTRLLELSQIVARAVEIASPLLEQRQHTLEVSVAAPDLLVEGDLERLTQVVSNLLVNAAKYTPPKGHITVRGELDGDEVVLRVHDTGIGMTPDVLGQAFELFVQGRQSIERAHGGLGLGLTIARSLVERHGGKISARSEGTDRGSELVVRLPRATPPALHGSPDVLEPGPHLVSAAGLRVLVVDDNQDAAEMLAEVLGFEGCRVRVAHDGPQALELGQAERFDLALLDIGLPVMDGYELARRLKELPHLGSAWLIAVTGYGQHSDRLRAIEAGFREHLVKPVDLARVSAIVAHARTARADAAAAPAQPPS